MRGARLINRSTLSDCLADSTLALGLIAAGTRKLPIFYRVRRPPRGLHRLTSAHSPSLSEARTHTRTGSRIKRDGEVPAHRSLLDVSTYPTSDPTGGCLGTKGVRMWRGRYSSGIGHFFNYIDQYTHKQLVCIACVCAGHLAKA